MNADGHAGGLDSAASVADLPLLQDDDEAQVWDRWNATWRDVHVVDAANERVAVFNLTDHDLADPANYATLKALLMDAANPGR